MRYRVTDEVLGSLLRWLVRERLVEYELVTEVLSQLVEKTLGDKVEGNVRLVRDSGQGIVLEVLDGETGEQLVDVATIEAGRRRINAATN